MAINVNPLEVSFHIQFAGVQTRMEKVSLTNNTLLCVIVIWKVIKLLASGVSSVSTTFFFQ